jgi:hypothetical protein
MKKTRISEREAIDVLDFIIKRTGLLDKVIVRNIGSAYSSKAMKNIYSVEAILSYYPCLTQNLTYGQHRFPVELKSKLYAHEFERIAGRRILSNLLKISSNGYDIFCHDDVVLKKNTTLEQLLIEKDLMSDNKE